MTTDSARKEFGQRLSRGFLNPMHFVRLRSGGPDRKCVVLSSNTLFQDPEQLEYERFALQESPDLRSFE